MNKCKVFVPAGALGTGISRRAVDHAIAWKPDIIACDAGSTDSGPYYLGTGKGKYARDAVKEDMRVIMLIANALSIPAAIGTCGTCGVDAGVDDMEAICREICEEENIAFRIAKVYTEQEPSAMAELYAQGKIHPLEAAPAVTAEVFAKCEHIVALSGAEPFMHALENGADIVLCGRATDTAIMSAMPLMKGCGAGPVWHGSKIAECGALCTVNPTDGGVFLEYTEDSFTVTPESPDNRCTVYSVSAHMLYENADPYRLREPSGTLDASGAEYIQVDDRTVRVVGSRFEKAEQYTMKLEGSSKAGFQTITIVGIQDKRIMQNPAQWFGEMKAFVQKKIEEMGLPQNLFSYSIRPYGWNAVSGESVKAGSFVPKELCVLLTVTAKSQEMATKIAKLFNPLLLHFPVRRDEQLPTYAFPFSPAETERGAVYEFRLNHVVDVDDPMELVRIEYVDVRGQEK